MRHIFQNRSRTVFVTLLGTAVVAVSFVFAVAFWLSGAMNTLARENSVSLIDSALQSKFRRIATLTEDYAHRDDSFDVIARRDDEAALQVIGRGATLGAAFDFLFVTEADGEPIYGYRTNESQSDVTFFNDDTTAEYVAAFGAGGFGPDDVVTGFTVVDGIVGLVAAARVLPFEDTNLDPAEWPLMYGMLQLNDARLRLVAGDLIVNQMDVVPAGDTGQIDPQKAQLTLENRSGGTIATLVWQPPRPGDALFWKTMPAMLVVSALLILGNVFVGLTANKQSAAVRDARQEAMTDPLTGVLNRKGLAEIASLPAMKKALNKGHAAVLYLDMNGLKSLNDNFGHVFGDKAISVTAMRLEQAVRPDDCVARIGGDEFVCVIFDEVPVAAALAVAARFKSKSERPLRMEEHSFQTMASIGIALSQPGLSLDAIIARADEAMYQAKKTRSDVPVIFNEKMVAAE